MTAIATALNDVRFQLDQAHTFYQEAERTPLDRAFTELRKAVVDLTDVVERLDRNMRQVRADGGL